MGSGRIGGDIPEEDPRAPFPLGPLRIGNYGLEKIEGAVLVFVLLLMVGLAFAQVMLRVLRPYNAFFQPVAWFGPFTQHLVVWVGIIGASIATREGRHFGVEALTKSFSVRGRRRLDAFLSTVSCGFALILTALAWNHLVLREVNAEAPVFHVDSLGLHVWRWQLLVIVPFELAVTCFRFALRALEALLLDDETWHEHDKSLRPELEKNEPAPTAAEPVVKRGPAPAPVGISESAERAMVSDSGDATPKAAPQASTVETPKPADSAELRPRAPGRSTDEVRTYRIADTGDVVEPEARPGEPVSEDDTALVDSEAGDSIEDSDAATRAADAMTERAAAQPPEPKKDGGPK